MSRESEALAEFKKRLEAFVRAGQNFVTAWEDLEHETSPRMIDRINEKYPFHKDFYEILNDMAYWEEMVKNLQAAGVLDWRPD